MTTKKLTFRQKILVAGTLFGMFFGAGNLIFPVHLGQMAGRNAVVAMIGFIITAVGIPISYYDLGVTTGKMAAKILTGEADISEMPIEFTEATPKYNASMCETLGIEPLEGYTAIEE